MDSTKNLKAEAKRVGIKLHEISEHTGLSISQVSRILNGKTVLKKNESMVIEAIQKLLKKRRLQHYFISVRDSLPEFNTLVLLTDGYEITFGYRKKTPDGWGWATTDGFPYLKNGEIVSECYLNDFIEVKLWFPLPKMSEEDLSWLFPWLFPQKKILNKSVSKQNKNDKS